MTLEIRATTLKQREKNHSMLFLVLLLKVRDLNALFQGKNAHYIFHMSSLFSSATMLPPLGIRRQCYFHDY